MKKAPIPLNDDERVAALWRLGMLDTEPEERFDAITREAAKHFGVSIAAVSLIDKDREWMKSCVGPLSKEGPRELSFCGHAMLADGLFIVENTSNDPRFSDNPYVVGPPFIKFYAGAVLRERKTNLPVGVFCIKGQEPRSMSAAEIVALLEFAKRAEDELNKEGGGGTGRTVLG